MSAQSSEKQMMFSTVSRTWWLAALRGVLAIVFGVAAFVWPGLTFDVLVVVFGAYAFVDGVVVLSFGLMAAGEHGRWWPLLSRSFINVVMVKLPPAESPATTIFW